LGDGAGPRAGVRVLGVVALAGSELEIAEPDDPRLAVERGPRVLERDLEERFRGRIARIPRVHVGRRDAHHAGRPFLPDRGSRERMWGVRFLPSGRDRLGGHVEMAVLHLHVVPRHLVVLETGLPLPRQAVELVAVPRTLDEFAVQAPLPQGSAGVVADARDRAERAVLPGDR